MQCDSDFCLCGQISNCDDTKHNFPVVLFISLLYPNLALLHSYTVKVSLQVDYISIVFVYGDHLSMGDLH